MTLQDSQHTTPFASLFLLACAAASPLLTGCDGTTHSEENTAHAAVSSESPEARAMLASVTREEPSAAQSERAADESKEKKKSPWEPETLDTGVDLSKIPPPSRENTGASQGSRADATGSNADAVISGNQTAAQVAQAKAAKAQAELRSQAAQRRQPVRTYGGGEPDGKVRAENPDSGFLHVVEKDAIHDFGDLNQGDKVHHGFELAISGAGEVIVDQIKTSCGCTVAETGVLAEDGGTTPYQLGSPLQPGSRLLVKAQLDTTRKRDHMRSVVTVISSDPRGSLQLQLQANVIPFFKVEPASLNFGLMKPSQVATLELKISSPSAGVFKLDVNREVMPDELKVELEPVDPQPDGRSVAWTARVTLGPDLPEGPRRNYQMQFMSDQVVENGQTGPNGEPARHSTVIYAVASVQGLVSVEPRYMSFGLMREGQEISRTVRVENNDTEYMLETPTTSLQGYAGAFEHPDSAVIEVTEVDKGRAYDIKLTMTGPVGLTGSFRGKLIVQVGHPSKPKLELPFTGVVRKVAPSPSGK